MADYIKFPLTQGQFTLVSECDIELISNYKWHASYHGKNGVDKWYAVAGQYCESGATKGKIRMHRLIMGLKANDKRVVHHLNDDSLDNRRENLEIVANNAANMAKCRNWKQFGNVGG